MIILMKLTDCLQATRRTSGYKIAENKSKTNEVTKSPSTCDYSAANILRWGPKRNWKSRRSIESTHQSIFHQVTSLEHMRSIEVSSEYIVGSARPRVGNCFRLMVQLSGVRLPGNSITLLTLLNSNLCNGCCVLRTP